MNPEETSIRTASLSDVPRITALSAQLGYEASPESIERRLSSLLASDRDAVFVAELPGQGVVGWIHAFLCQLIEADFRAEIGGLIVDAGFHRRGLGRALVAAVDRWARERGVAELSVRCQTKRLDAHRFYETLGFEGIKTQRVFRRRC